MPGRSGRLCRILRLALARYEHRCGLAFYRIDAQLSRSIRAPAVDLAGARVAAGVPVAGVEAGEADAAGDQHRHQAVDRRAVADCADLVLPPAVAGRVALEPAGVPDVSAGNQLRERDSPADRDGNRALGLRAVAQRSIAVEPPAVRDAGRVAGAAVLSQTRRHRREHQSAGNRDGLRVGGKIQAPDAELSGGVVAPAVGDTTRGEATGVPGEITAGAERLEGESPGHRHRYPAAI